MGPYRGRSHPPPPSRLPSSRPNRPRTASRSGEGEVGAESERQRASKTHLVEAFIESAKSFIPEHGRTGHGQLRAGHASSPASWSPSAGGLEVGDGVSSLRVVVLVVRIGSLPSLLRLEASDPSLERQVIIVLDVQTAHAAGDIVHLFIVVFPKVALVHFASLHDALEKVLLLVGSFSVVDGVGLVVERFEDLAHAGVEVGLKAHVGRLVGGDVDVGSLVEGMGREGILGQVDRLASLGIVLHGESSVIEASGLALALLGDGGFDEVRLGGLSHRTQVLHVVVLGVVKVDSVCRCIAELGLVGSEILLGLLLG